MAPAAVTEDVPNGTSTKCCTCKCAETNGTNGHVETKPEETEKTATSNGDTKSEATADDKKDETTQTDEKKDADKHDAAEDDKDKPPEDQTMKCEFKHLDRRYDEKDEHYFSERKTEIEKPAQKDWWRLYAFCIVKHYDSRGDHSSTQLYVNPQPLRQLLRDVIGDYPSDPIDVDDVQIEAPYHALFHYRKELEAEGPTRFADDQESLQQFNLLMDWIKNHFESEIAAYEKCVSGEVRAISYENAWTLLPPDTLVHCKILDQDRAFRVRRYYDEYDEHGNLAGMTVSCRYVDFDGEDVGTLKTHLTFRKYTGVVQLSELDIIPLHLHEDGEAIRQSLLARGRKWEKHLGQHYVQYNGLAVIKKEMQGYARFGVNGRVMIDCATFHRLAADHSFVVKKLPSSKPTVPSLSSVQFASETKEFESLTDEQAILTNATVRGYSFTNKRFLEFFVDKLEPIQWNTTCFDGLVLDPDIKKTVQALVSNHTRERPGFDDIVKGKGQGLVCVLHGPPGVGKTLTAECVAEYVRRPLYMVSSGDLGCASTELDAQLTQIMDMTATWRAVLLIDEADVFLEQRALHDLHRNAMVSVFLRVLEYYTGILFLTTNRVTTFDEAFKSRIHIPIRYTDLSFESKLQIWKNFCGMVPGGVDIDERGLERLAEHDLNGRQIKNAVKAAESLASFEGVKLDLARLLQVTKIQAVFEKDLSSVAGVDYTAPGGRVRDADRRNMFL
ncbi:P-loop containing nucleoside triphosphate hydrolase protein [Sordaria brevicollis]|uniref:P-loop containing nucleoside triphosphate hydrolase protein n=1 Tax=Sordaria brevicollis TaxID=83679 RepID=A0AAE0PCQ7_SORBR|nr:P-loop containing nucleoside triphosphate hydrolase protein [Sordaria brevicollis]